MIRPVGDQVMVIVGASSGIGLVTARRAARHGARLVLAARNRRDLERAVEVVRREGGDGVAVPVEVTDYAQLEHLARTAAERFGRIDTWVNCAAVLAYAEFQNFSMEDFRRVMEVDFLGQVYGAKAALPYLEATGGALVCVGSAVSDRGFPLMTPYCAAKHALKGWVEGLRVELQKRKTGVRLTLVKPTSLNTPIFDKAKTALGVRPMPVPPVYDPGLAADAILRAAVSDIRDLYVGRGARMLSWANRLSPKLLDVVIRLVGYRVQMTHEPKSAAAPSNLHAPVDHDGGERAGWEWIPRDLGRPVREHPWAATLSVAAAAGLGALAARKAA